MSQEKKQKSVQIFEERTKGIKARTILWYLTFFGFAINYVVRVNISIAIVDMIDLNFKASTSNKTELTSECIIDQNDSSSNRSISFDDNKHERYMSVERRFLDYIGYEYERDGFKWNSHEINAVLGSFYWLNWATQLPGGILAARYGTKVIYGWFNYFAVILCFITPLAAYLDIRFLIAIRLLCGVTSGATWPAMHQLVGKWIPSNERSRFVTAYMGSSIGVAVFFPLFGYIIKLSSWEWVFHFSFIIGTVWFIMWQYFVFDSPEEHPRIDPAEKGYILKVLGSSIVKADEKPPIPWIKMLTSKCLWLNTICQLGGLWGLFTLITQAPVYFRVIHGWSVEKTGLFSGIPHLLRTGFSIAFSHLGDYLLSNSIMSRTNVRKLATFFHILLNGIICFGLAYAGCNTTQAVFFLTLSLAFHGAVTTGALASMVDNTPNFSGIFMGITSTITILTGMISPIVVGYITFENQTVEAWQHIFEITAVIMIICGIIFILFNDSSLQEWNKPPQKYEAVAQKDTNLDMMFSESINKIMEEEKKDRE